MSKSNEASQLYQKVKAQEEVNLNNIYARVAEIIKEKRDSVDSINQVSHSHLANRVESEALLSHQLDKMEKLERSLDNLCFGRVFLDDGMDYYIGKIGVSDLNQDNMLLDWRAPVAGKFYQASSVKPSGVACKRIYRSRQKNFKVQIDSLSDEEFIKGVIDEVILSEDSALKDALNRRRTGKMSEIVATIEGEQDRIMRLPTDGTLVIQGAPGTGKTVVGLHRAAYLLYVEREKLKNQGVLVVGPNNKFLNYIDQVLPLLGEYDVDLALLENMVSTYTLAYQDESADIALKNDAKFVLALEETLKNLIKIPSQGLEINLTGERVYFSGKELERVLKGVLAQDYSYNESRELFLKKVMELGVRKLKESREIEDEDFGDEEFEEILEEFRDSEVARKKLNLLYMPYSAEQVLYKLATDKNLWRGSKFDGYKVLEKFADRYRLGEYSLNDVLLLDVLAGKLGLYNPTYRDGHRESTPRSNDLVDPKLYGHLVVDEAQEITYLGWRALGRRIVAGSATLLGDKFQQDERVPALDWKEAASALGARKLVVEELKINYRTPMEINELSLAYLRSKGKDRIVESIRDREDSVSLSLGTIDLAFLKAQYDALSKDGLVTIIAPDKYVAMLSGLGLEVLTPKESKGVEFDHVIILDPVLLEEESATGLYVSLTRATQRLWIFQEERAGFPWEAIYA